MLTATDIHYIVGLLTFWFESDQNIDLELGSTISDIASDQERDIDITLTYKNPDGSVSALKGLEVKKHKRPLTVEHVEQLCAKFDDIPSITHRGIISSSGFTKPAIKKAEYHNVNLYCLDTWDSYYSANFFKIAFAKNLPVTERMFYWHKVFPKHSIVFQDKPFVRRSFSPQTRLFTSKGEPYKFQTLEALYSILDKRTLREFMLDRKASNRLNDKQLRKANVTVNMKDGVYIDLGDDKLSLDHIDLVGEIICLETEIKPEFKILRKQSESEPFIGCAIAETKMGLFGISLRAGTNAPIAGLFRVATSDRLKQKIYREKFTRIEHPSKNISK